MKKYMHQKAAVPRIHASDSRAIVLDIVCFSWKQINIKDIVRGIKLKIFVPTSIVNFMIHM